MICCIRFVCLLFTEQQNLECKQLHMVTHKGSKKTQTIIVFKINYYTHTTSDKQDGGQLVQELKRVTAYERERSEM